MDDAVSSFHADGYAVVRGVLSRGDVQALVRAAREIFPPAARGAGDRGVPQLLRPSLVHPEFRRWLERELPFELAARCVGAGRVHLLQDALLVKPPGSRARLEWHQDASYFGYLEPLVACSVRLALGPCTVATGCMRVLVGSHREGLRAPGRFGESQVADASAASDLERYREVAVELEPGDISLHSALTLHASYENTSALARETIVTHLASDACRIALDRVPPAARDHFQSTSGHLDPDVFWPLPL